MLLLMDNFEIYGKPKEPLDQTWLNQKYIVEQTTANGLNVYESETTDKRLGLGNTQPTSGQRAVMLPLGEYLTKTKKITISQKLLNFVPSTVAIGGVSILGASRQDLIHFGFSSNKMGFVRYIKEGVVQEDAFVLPTGLGMQQDTIEWSFEKEETSEAFKGFTLWVNNRPAYVGNVMVQRGNPASLAAIVLGGVPSKAEGSVSSDASVLGTSNVSIPVYGTTDLVVNTGQRLGTVRVLSRGPSRDAGPNSMASTQGGSHSDVVSGKPPSKESYLTAISTTAQEMYAAPAYEGLSSEAILGVGFTYFAQKNNPEAFDLQAYLKLEGKEHATEAVPVDLTLGPTSIVLERNPWTKLPWTPLEANGINFGMKVI